MRIRPSGIHLIDALIKDLVATMAAQKWTDGEIAKEVARRHPHLDKITTGNIAGVRNRHGIESGQALRTQFNAEFVATRADEVLTLYRGGMSQLAIAKKLGVPEHLILRVTWAARGVSDRSPKASTPKEAVLRSWEQKQLSYCDDRFARAMAGQSFAYDARTKAYGKAPQMASGGLVMTQSTAGSCADAA